MIKFKFPEQNSESVLETLDRIRKNAEVQKDFGDIKIDAYDFFWMVQQIKHFEEFKSEAIKKCPELQELIDQQHARDL